MTTRNGRGGGGLGIPVRRHTLENGLRVVLSPDPSVPVVALNLWYGVGSRNEREGRTGFAHLFEHMMFQGSAHVPKNRHFELVEGAGGSLNASTWFDRTNYYETVPSHMLDLVLWLEADRMGWMLPALDQEKLDNQISVVKNERKQRYDNQPYGDWDERIQSLLWPPEHPYHHTVIGSMEDIGAATLEDVEEFFRTFYTPRNAVLTLAGDLEPGSALESIQRYFGEIPGGDPIPPVPGPDSISPVIGDTVRTRVEAEVPLPRVYLAARIPPATDPAHYAAEMAADILGSGRASRLYRKLVREERIARDVLSFAFPLVNGASMLLLWATGLEGTDPERLEAAVEEELDALSSPRPGEMERALALTETRLVSRLEQVADRADLLSMYELQFGDAGRLNSELDRVRGVTAGEVEAFARGFLGRNNRAIVTYVPGGGA